jgi:hypothetical protein
VNLSSGLSNIGVALLVIMAVVAALLFARSVESFVGYVVILIGLTQVAVWIGGLVRELLKRR